MEYINRLLHRHSPNTSGLSSPEPESGNEGSSIKADQQQQQHDVKVRFIREFADASTLPIANDGITETNSLSSASSFQSLASTLSSKCSSGICVDSSPSKNADRSYTNADISGLDDLISACENIRLDEATSTTVTTNEATNDQSFTLRQDPEDHSPDQTFTSAIDQDSPDRDLNVTNDTENPEDPKINLETNVIVTQLDTTREINPENSTSNLDKSIDLRLNVDEDIARESSINPENTNLRLDATIENSEEQSPIISEFKQINPDHDIEANVGRDNLPINVDFDTGTEIERGKLPINSENQINLDTTIEIKTENSTINVENKINLDVTTEIKSENSPINPENQINLDHAETAETRIENSLINLENTENLDHDKTTEIRAESSLINPQDRVNLDLDKTIEIGKENSVINPENQVIPDIDELGEPREDHSLINQENTDLDKTGEIGRENLSINPESHKKFDPNTTSVIHAENSPENCESDDPELELTRTIDGETEASLAHADQFCTFVNSVKSTESKVDSASEEIVECVSDIAKSSSERLTSKDRCDSTELAKTENFVETLKTPKKNEEESKRHENHPLDYPPASFSDFYEKIPSTNPEPPKVDETATSPLKITTIIQKEESKIEKSFFTEIDDSPSLPSLSSVCLPSRLNETIDLPPLDITRIKSPLGVDKKPPKSPSVSSAVSDKFVDLGEPDLLSAIQEPTFIRTQSNIEDSKDLRGVKNSRDSTFSLVESSEKNASERRNDVNLEKNIADSKLPDQANIVEESRFHDSDEKHDSSDELNSTVTIQDISADDILAAPESEQYAEFVPQKQSTALVPVKVENFQSRLVAGAGLIGGQGPISRPINLPEDFSEFVPQRQSTVLPNCVARLPEKIERQTTPFVTGNHTESRHLPILADNRKISPKRIENIDDRCNFMKLEIAANSIANDILSTSLELAEENEHFVSAESEILSVLDDQTNFDFLLSKTPRKNPRRDLRAESLYVNFDPLVSNTSMLPQSIQTPSPPSGEARNGGDNETTIANIGTPKRNPAIAAIDRLLFYSPMTANTTPTNTNATITNTVTQKTNDTEEKLKPVEEPSAETINMAKELELVRTTVLQLEEQLEKLKIDHEEALEKQTSYKEKINQLQAQLAQEIKNKNEITVVVDEYEISISRLVAERERDRKNLDLEKAKLQEELAAAKIHLDNTEAAFNDVHLKYERLKGVVATYKSNEIALKESLQENVEIIKSLENRYEQVKSHATARLEKANLDLDAIRKQNESETVRLHAMLRKAELKSNSLAELVEQKTKENKELTQILDELIARVGRNKSE